MNKKNILQKIQIPIIKKLNVHEVSKLKIIVQIIECGLLQVAYPKWAYKVNWEQCLSHQVSHSSLSGLRSWKRPAVSSSMFYASQFKIFLPPSGKSALGDTWWIIPSELNIFTGYLPNNRYHPPTPRGKEVQIYLLISFKWVQISFNAWAESHQQNIFHLILLWFNHIIEKWMIWGCRAIWFEETNIISV